MSDIFIEQEACVRVGKQGVVDVWADLLGFLRITMIFPLHLMF